MNDYPWGAFWFGAWLTSFFFGRRLEDAGRRCADRFLRWLGLVP